ncbi:membrane dipeptidase [Spirosoma sp. BT702]|uniref:Membrane dipeptidase n=1 Tax=Spirosoma profusum TaxID=2771354 RepID=A0A926Y2Y4_9BACT|nr:membrane dipeptidase [Spirosoma profusum]MBD2702903.1 membrane dipeptidase [Spirosoma profusum]
MNVPNPLLIDAHLDMSLNAIEWNRDLRLTVNQIRAQEQGMNDKIDRGRGTVAFPELRRGNIGLVVATQIARFNQSNGNLPGAGWNSPEQAWAMTQAQRIWYETMQDAGDMIQIRDREGLEKHVSLWLDENKPNENKPIGYILSLEGADSLVNLSYLEKAYSYGLRAMGPAHYSTGRYAPGTGLSGPLTPLGRELVREMDRLGMILDATHLTDEGFDEALSLFKGPVWASHHNCRALAPHQRQLTDDQIRQLTERGGVIGGCFDAWMMKPGFTQRISSPAAFGITIETIIDHYDHICQLTGNSEHIAIGSDLDGTYGTEQSPSDLDTIADLQKLTGLLAKRGYSASDIDNIFHKNWLRFLRKAWK